MLQGFHWQAAAVEAGWYTILRENAQRIKAAGFTMVWFPPPSVSASPQGDEPNRLHNLNSAYGTETQLREAIGALRPEVSAIADIVINHRSGTRDWADFTNPDMVKGYPGWAIELIQPRPIARRNDMQIDFHHATTYVTARLAGFAHEQADIVAHAAQYVDDATSSGMITFDTGPIYARISSAHKMVDPRNAKKLKNHLVWIPFHFLPGNDGLGEGQNPIGTFVNKLVCKPDSPIARRMIKQTILRCLQFRQAEGLLPWKGVWILEGAGIGHQ